MDYYERQQDRADNRRDRTERDEDFAFEQSRQRDLDLISERFWSKVNKSGECWEWMASIDKGGYGRFYVGGKHKGAHIVSYELSVMKVPDGLVLDHLCRNRKCVNPNHLEPKTFKENVLCGISFSATNSAKTHCVNGHEYTKENTYLRPNGNRDCKECIRSRVNKYKSKEAA